MGANVSHPHVEPRELPPDCCTAREDCRVDGVCHDPMRCGERGRPPCWGDDSDDANSEPL
ncbi:MAG: hypothetical protein GOVbin1573_28 [Prokaryotic dsDNA virus sp.]|nr:MAG: hypothetical protein GOVbin1573_28 [Prokaryotic dsDNA virus sp.]